MRPATSCATFSVMFILSRASIAAVANSGTAAEWSRRHVASSLLIILIMVFCLYQMFRNLLATIGELLRLERRSTESDYCALMPSPHINCCQDAVDRGKMGGMSATLENIRVNLPLPEKYRITYCSCSGSRRAISSLHLLTK
jgi:hypothetical protein